ncbi:G3E family GTPase [Sediminihabitans luteus]|uniref:G3E family GTPase n=1 Tax=Sediminihabitans luteus TaxID=1138585 RepID=A0A2M9D178_9CELL|nr:GTP-binding protein [Sediminihabitans luteus]PJJ77845.1 G3E family GTPase [Sediminihabitans luteus]GII99797.1 cobalamin biosynthesis protein CobW [Sediminihabitans luteus]
MTARLSVLGGYLGAGKTTLLNGLLDTAGGRRIAVVVNDFGTVNVDRRLVRSATADTLELSDGCVCCTLRGEVADVMTRLARRDDLDHVVVEASGVADPAGLATWGRFPGLAPGPTIVCVDVTRITRWRRDPYVGDLVERQLARADVLVLTRTDLAAAETVAAAEAACLALAPGARVVRSRGGDVPAAVLLDDVAQDLAPAPVGIDPHRSESVALQGLVDVPRLVARLGRTPATLVRAKGFVRDARSPGVRTLVQLAGGRVEVTHAGPWAADDVPGLVLVAAGPDARAVLASTASGLRATALTGTASSGTAPSDTVSRTLGAPLPVA